MLRVRVLGPLHVTIDGIAVPPPASHRAWLLLAWLALHPGPHRRRTLAARFWPDVLDASARASLRSAVWTLRRALGPAAGDCLVATRETLALADAPPVWVDARAFAAELAAGRLVDAVALCERGELLADADDEWVLQERDAHRERLAGALERLAAAADAEGELDAAVAWTRRQASLDPFDEAAHRRLMERLAAAGERTAALATYRRLADRLARELALAPSSRTRTLAERLRRDGATDGDAGGELPRAGVPRRATAPER